MRIGEGERRDGRGGRGGKGGRGGVRGGRDHLMYFLGNKYALK